MSTPAVPRQQTQRQQTQRQRGGRRRGATLTEFALTLPPILFLTTGVFDITTMMSVETAVVQATRGGARIGAATTKADGAPAEEADIESAAINHAVDVLQDSGYPCTTDCEVTAEYYLATSGYYYIRVEVEYPFVPTIGMVPGLERHVFHEIVMLAQKQ